MLAPAIWISRHCSVTKCYPPVHDNLHINGNAPLGRQAPKQLLHRIQLVHQIPRRPSYPKHRRMLPHHKPLRLRTHTRPRQPRQRHRTISISPRDKVLPIHHTRQIHLRDPGKRKNTKYRRCREQTARDVDYMRPSPRQLLNHLLDRDGVQ